MNDLFLQLYKNEDIERHFTIRETPQQNEVVERMKHTLLEKVQCLLSNVGLTIFWAEPSTYAIHLNLINRLPSSVIGGKTLMKVQSGKAPQDYDMLKIFGCPTSYHIKEDKLNHRTKKLVFLGFKRGVKGYKLWDSKYKKLVVTRDVTFDETSMMKPTSYQQVDRGNNLFFCLSSSCKIVSTHRKCLRCFLAFNPSLNSLNLLVSSITERSSVFRTS